MIKKAAFVWWKVSKAFNCISLRIPTDEKQLEMEITSSACFPACECSATFLRGRPSSQVAHAQTHGTALWATGYSVGGATVAGGKSDQWDRRQQRWDAASVQRWLKTDKSVTCEHHISILSNSLPTATFINMLWTAPAAAVQSGSDGYSWWRGSCESSM